MPFSNETWSWIRTAPLPVVLAISLSMSGMLATWVWAVEKEQGQQATAVAVATVEAHNAVMVANRLDDKLEKANKKLDDLLEVILSIRASEMAETARIAAALAKKEGKK